jgi:hypothetical protein
MSYITIDQATELVKKIIVRAPKALARYAKVKSAYDKAVDNYEAIDDIYIEMSYVVEALEGIGAYWTWPDMMTDLADDLLAVENRRNELNRLIDDVEEQVADIDRNILSAFDDLSGNR